MILNLEYIEKNTSGLGEELLKHERKCFEYSEDSAVDWLKEYAASFHKEFQS